MNATLQKPEPVSSSQEQVRGFSERNVIPATMETMACGDGRYTKDQNIGGLRLFGGDMGALAAYWDAGKQAGRFTSVDDIGDCVRDYVQAKEKVLKGFGIEGAEAKTLYFHTDEHGDEIHGKYGCGHMKNLANGDHAKEYGSTGEEIEALFAYVRNPENAISHVVTKLEGDHAEKRVILVKGEQDTVPNHTIRSMDPETGEMNFVVDLDRIQEFFNRLSTALHQTAISAGSLFDAYMKQQTITAGILAPHKEMIAVYLDQNGQVIRTEDAGVVAPIA